MYSVCNLYFLGVPAEAYLFGLGIFPGVVLLIFSMPVVAHTFITVFYNLKLVSIYEVREKYKLSACLSDVGVSDVHILVICNCSTSSYASEKHG